MDKFICISGSYVIEVLQAATAEENAKMEQKFNGKFNAAFSNKNIFTYTGMKVGKNNCLI